MMPHTLLWSPSFNSPWYLSHGSVIRSLGEGACIPERPPENRLLLLCILGGEEEKFVELIDKLLGP